jgi:hypothetical protein
MIDECQLLELELEGLRKTYQEGEQEKEELTQYEEQLKSQFEEDIQAFQKDSAENMEKKLAMKAELEQELAQYEDQLENERKFTQETKVEVSMNIRQNEELEIQIRAIVRQIELSKAPKYDQEEFLKLKEETDRLE